MKKKWFIISAILIIALIIISRYTISYDFTREFGNFLSMPLVFCIVGSLTENKRFIRNANRYIILLTLGLIFMDCVDYFFIESIDYSKIIIKFIGGVFTLFIWWLISRVNNATINSKAE